MQSNTFCIFTDTGCDISPAQLAEWGVQCAALTFRFNDSEKEYVAGDMTTKEFYQKICNVLLTSILLVIVHLCNLFVPCKLYITIKPYTEPTFGHFVSAS